MATYWEQEYVTHDIPVHEINMQLVGSTEAILQVRGDEHYGLRGLDDELMVTVLKSEQKRNRKNMLVLNTGDCIENANKRSIGHGFDIQEPDPVIQIREMVRIYENIDKHLYASKWRTMKSCKNRNPTHARKVGVIGNHEYRTRKDTGIWLNKELYGNKGTIDAGIHCLIHFTIWTKKPKIEKTYKIYLAHRLTNSAAGISPATMIKNFQKKKADIDADIYVCGHYHRRFVLPDIKFNSEGKRKKVLYACNPAPCLMAEYAEWALYSPSESGIFLNLQLPIDDNPKGTV
jgi:hypothetical protein